MNTAEASPIPAPLRIGILARSDQTRSELASYFARVGAVATHLPDLQALHAPDDVLERIHAIVIFPDDFEPQAMDAALAAFSARTPGLFQLIITRQPLRFLSTSPDPMQPPHRAVLPRPSFGWRILDAIRDHRQRIGTGRDAG